MTMSDARNHALIEKWADIATAPSTTNLPALASPTSPKITKFCCCPNKKRYNVNHQKKSISTLHVRNILVDNDFTYIDDTSSEHDNCSKGSSEVIWSKNLSTKAYEEQHSYIIKPKCNSTLFKCKHYSDFDAISFEEINETCNTINYQLNKNQKNTNPNRGISLKNSKTKFKTDSSATVWSPNEEVSCGNECHKAENDPDTRTTRAKSGKCISNYLNDKVFYSPTELTDKTTSFQQNPSESKTPPKNEQIIGAVTNLEISDNFHNVVTKVTPNRNGYWQEKQQQNPQFVCNNKSNEQLKEKETIQRLSNSKLVLSFKDNNFKENSSAIISPEANGERCANEDNNSDYCQTLDKCTKQNNCLKLQNKMTIATTSNVSSNRKRSDCELTTSVVQTTSTMAKENDIEKTVTEASKASTNVAAITATTSPLIPALPSPSATPTSLRSTSIPTSPTPGTTTTVIKTILVKRSPTSETNPPFPITTPATPTIPTTPLTPTTPTSNVLSLRNGWEAKSNEKRYSVKERVAAIVAGNEQIKQQKPLQQPQHQQNDNSIKFNKTQCNKISNNMTNKLKNETLSANVTKANALPTNSTEANIKVNVANIENVANEATLTNVAKTLEEKSVGEEQEKESKSFNQCVISNNECIASTTTKATTQSVVATENSIADNNSIPLKNKSLLLNDDDTKLQRSILLSNTGCATLPRRRSNNININTISTNINGFSLTNNTNYNINTNIDQSNSKHDHGNNINNKYGSNSIRGAMTAYDKNFSSQKFDKNMSANGIGSDPIPTFNNFSKNNGIKSFGNGKFSAIDNLDLALSADLTDDDGEDPYIALQEYLERVKHEINEVFESRKACQRIQQRSEGTEQPNGDMPNKVSSSQMVDIKLASSDELTHSIETVSGLDKACGSGQDLNSKSCERFNFNTSNETSNTNISDNKSKVCSDESLNCKKSKNSYQPYGNCSSVKVLERIPSTIELKALPPPPLSSKSDDSTEDSTTLTNGSLKQHLSQQSLSTSSSTGNESSSNCFEYEDASADEVNIWANKVLRDLNSFMTLDKYSSLSSSSACSSPVSKTSPMLLSAAASAAIKCRYGSHHQKKNATSEHCSQQTDSTSGPNVHNIVLRPAKHTTIPLQSFNLDCGLSDGPNATMALPNLTGVNNKAHITYMRTLSAPSPYQDDDKKSSYLGTLPPGKTNRNSLATFNVVSAHQQEQQQAQQQQLHNHLHHHHQQNQSLHDYHQKIEHQPFDEEVEAEEYGKESGEESHNVITTVAPATTVLKIEENLSGKTISNCVSNSDQKFEGELVKTKQQHQLNNESKSVPKALDQRLTKHDEANHHHQSSQQQKTPNMNSNQSFNIKGINNKNMVPVAPSSTTGLATSLPKRERINHASSVTNTGISSTTNTINPFSSLYSNTPNGNNSSNSNGTNGFLLNANDTPKKGSTSTIWTSEESILRSVGAVDEDNNSTSSSACEEATGVLSSGKSGISLDSSGLDNDNNESGIGTATPPKDMTYWKNLHNDNESVSSLDAMRKVNFKKSSSVASSDDPDLLEVLSLCDENQGSCDDILNEANIDEHLKKGKLKHHQPKQQNKERQKRQKQRHDKDGTQQIVVGLEMVEDDDGVHIPTAEEDANDADADEDEEGHDEFETIPYCNCDCTDGETNNANSNNNHSIRLGGHVMNYNNDNNQTSSTNVVLRRKCSAAPIMVPYGKPKGRSHSLDTSSLPTSYYHLQHYNNHQTLQQHHHHLNHLPLTRKLQHLQYQHHQQQQTRCKDRIQLSLALRQEPFQSLLAPTHFQELPSPSSASLHSGHESLGIQELTTKSNSAPLLLKQEKKRDDFSGQKLTLRYSRSQSDRYLAEIEAIEACKWLRAAGFPQYAQMYEDHQFPVDLTNVAKDHTNLDNDQLQSLYRRLCILNRCATMRLDQSHKAQTPQQKEDSDDENFALSENWTFQPHIRRWSRIGEMGLELPPVGKLNTEKTESSSKESSPDRFEDDTYDLSGAGLSLKLPGSSTAGAGESVENSLNESGDSASVRLRRTGSERFKDGAKALLRRVESIKSRRRKRQNRDGVVISGPQALDLSQLGQRGSVRKPDIVYSTPPSPSAVSPMHTFPKNPFLGNDLKLPSSSDNFLHPNRASPKRTPTTPRSMRTSPLHFFQMPHLKEGKSDDSSSYYSDSQESSAGGKLTVRKTPSKARRFLQRSGKVDDIGAHSDSECHQGRKLLIKDANSNNTEVKMKKLQRGGSLNLGKDPKKRDGFRTSSFRSRSTTRKEGKTEETDTIKRSPVVRWHSFQMEERPHMIFRKCLLSKIDPHSNEHGIPFAAMSAGQLQIIRKLALVILTGYMERYCPTHRSGWNWELPKFIKKIKMPDYKDKKVFGVPLLLILQRTGQTLPTAVKAAFRWLQLNALDQIGIFRKSGVKSRIIKLKEVIEISETTAECMDVFNSQQAYDVADMLKQYFRDLPESLLTTKMSETFGAIFQHLPPEVRLHAVQCAVLLIPDENREILYALLEFLTLVADNSPYNQMTTNNLAVCLAPSLFHSNISTGLASVTASPRRKGGKSTGLPDPKELSEAKASHECLSFMIDHYREIFTASKDLLSKCSFGYMEESKPVPLESLGEGNQFHNWRGYLYECTSATIKEGRERTRGWITVTPSADPNVEIGYKKVGDGHPLRLWRCIAEIEGPPKDVLEYITRQRASWDPFLLQSQTLKKLDERTEIFQYALDGQFPTDFVILRSWQTDLPRGACVIVETSIDYVTAKPMFNSIRGVVLASRYLIEPCGGGKSRVMHMSRVDIKGKTPEWYNKSFGHICSHNLARIRLAFKNVTEGPESKV